jgi:hypothetical protein
MKGFAGLILLAALSGCAASTSPTPAELAQNPARYNDRQITTCGQVIAGGGKCSLKTGAREIWLSSASKLCAAPVSNTSYASISGTFSALASGTALVIRKANIKPLDGSCPGSGT